jgi:hypothetical protein
MFDQRLLAEARVTSKLLAGKHTLTFIAQHALSVYGKPLTATGVNE